MPRRGYLDAAESTPLARRGRLSPLVVDGALAVVLAVLALATYESTAFTDEGPSDLTFAAAILMLVETLPLTFRRRRPDLVLIVIGGTGLLLPVLDIDASPFSVFGILVAVYTMSAYGKRRDSLLTAAITAAVLVLVTVAAGLDFTETLTNYLIFGVVWLTGETVRARRAYAAELEARARRLERDRETEAERAVAQERARMARELHDVVAHEVGVMVVQAGAARLVLREHPERAEEALAAIEASGRGALAEMRRLLGVLRRDDDAPTRAPQPGLGRLDELVDQVREAGLAVTVAIDGEPHPLNPGIDLNAYRIVQEALTNCLKHAGPAAHAQVRLKFGAGHFDVDVLDDGRGAAEALRVSADGGGQGIAGMRERAELFGGELRAGPRPGGGFAVRASFPLQAER